MNPRQIAQLVGDEITKRLLRLDTKTFQRGIVSATAGNRATVAIEGAAGTIPNILCMTGYSPKIDDKVLVLSIGSSRSNFLIVGRLDEDGIVPPVANEVPSGTVNGSNTVFTLSADYIPGTLAVYLNGMRQKITDDYTETAGHTITFVGAPLSGDKILVDYLRLTGSVTPNESEYGFEWGVTPSESPNGSISVFTVNTYIGGSMQVTVDGIFQRRGIDFTEQPSAGTITFITDLPATGQSVRCSYQRVFVSMGGADMVDGFHANSTPQANKLYPLNSNAKFPVSIMDNPYRFSAYMSASQTTVLNAWTKLQMNTEEFDLNNNYNNTTYGYTIPVTGYYEFFVMAQMLSQTGNPFLIGISLDGTTDYRRLQEIPNTTGNITLSGMVDVSLPAGSIVYPIYYSSAAGKTLNSGITLSKFSGKLVAVV